MEKNLKIGILNDIYGSLLTENQRDMLKSYYDDDLSLGEIAELNGISRQGVRDSIVKGKAALESYEKNLNLFDRMNVIKSRLKDCLDCVDLADIKERIREVIELLY